MEKKAPPEFDRVDGPIHESMKGGGSKSLHQSFGGGGLGQVRVKRDPANKSRRERA